MGWTGSFIWWNKRDTNKDLLVRAFPSMKKYIDEGTRKLSQKGSDVYVLDRNKDGIWYVVCYLCRREKGGEFMTKDIDAIYNHCFGFPKSWIALLDKNDEVVQEYIKAREEWESKQKPKKSFKVGDYVKCVASYEISWNGGYKIQPDEVFYVHIDYLNPFSSRKTKSYVICKPCCNRLASFGRRIKGSTFNNLKSAVKLSESEIQQIIAKAKEETV